MKIRITDLLDQYYDDTVKLDEPQLYETPAHISPIKNNTKKSPSMHKPLLIAASLMLVLCGVFVLHLGLDRNSVGTALAEGDSIEAAVSSVLEPASAQPEEALLPQESLLEESQSEQEETVEGPETNDTAEGYDPYEVSEHRLLVAELMLPMTQAGEEGTLLNLTLDLTYGDYIWYYEAPNLTQALYDLSPEGDLTDALHDEAFQQAYVLWGNAFLETYMANTFLNFSDGSSIQLGSGDVMNFGDGVFSEASSFADPAEYQGIDLDSAVPVSVTINGETFEFEEATALMTDPTPMLDVPEGALPDMETEVSTASTNIETDIFPEETSGSAVIYGDGTQVYPAAEDINGDGLLTAALNLEYGYMDSSAYLAVFTLDLASGEYTWYNRVDSLLVLMSELLQTSNPTEQDFSDALGDTEFSETYLDWSNYVLEMIKSNAYLVFTDGTSVRLGCGDKVGFEEEVGLFWDTGKLSWLEGDYGVDLSNLEPSHLKILGYTYYFEYE